MGLRQVTLPVTLVIGLGTAAALAEREWKKRRKEAGKVRARILKLLEKIEFHVNGDPFRIQPHALNICIPGVDSEGLMMVLRDVMAISNGSACTSESYTPSHVLKAMGLTDDDISTSIRISWGPSVTPDEVPIGKLIDAVISIRG